MQYFRPGSQLRQLITMLSIVGEYPIRSLYLLGNERAYKALVHKLTTPETFRIPQTETEMTTRLLTVTGKGNSRSVRFYKGALPILDWHSIPERIHIATASATRWFLSLCAAFPGNLCPQKASM